MNKCLASILGSGGARGAMEVGALRALLEAGFDPDLPVGTSIGPIDATGLAVWEVGPMGVKRLGRFFREAADADLMDRQPARVTLHALAGRPSDRAGRHFAENLVAQGIPAVMRYGTPVGVRAALVAADLDTGQTILCGQDPEERILGGIPASSAGPPWFVPALRSGDVVMDGGHFSNLPIEESVPTQ